MLITLGFSCGTGKPYESNLGPLKMGPEVSLVYRNSRKKLQKHFQLLRRKVPRSKLCLCCCRASRIFRIFLISTYFIIFHHISTIFYASNIVQSNLLSCEQLSKFLFACLVLGWNKFHQVVRLSLGFVSSKQLNMLP